MPSETQIVPVEIVGSSTFGRYAKVSPAKTYNMFISDEALINYAGWKRIIEFIAIKGEGRGIFASSKNDLMLVVVSSAVYVLYSNSSNQQDSDFEYNFVGSISTSTGFVSMDENLSDQICIVDGLRAYIYNVDTGSLTKQSLNSNLIPNYVCFHNSYFLFGNATTGSNGSKWYAYTYNSPTTITEAFEFALQTKPSNAVAVQRLPGQGNNVIVFGTNVAEIWTNVPGITGYQRNSSVNIDYGCINVSTLASSDRYTMWLGSNETNSLAIMIFKAGEGYDGISTDGIDYLLGTLQYPQQSTAFFYRDDGHLFYQLTFYNKADNLTIIYDVDTKKFYNGSDQHLNYHPARNVAYFNNSIYFISLNNGSLYQSGTSFTTYNENIGTKPLLWDEELNYSIQRIRICSSIRFPGAPRFCSSNLNVTIDQGNDPDVNAIELAGNLNYITTQAGDDIITETSDPIVTQSTGFGDNDSQIPYCPRVDLTISKDGGVTFSNTVGIQLNAAGYRQNILRWSRQFGQANDLTFKFRFWGRSYFCILDAVVEVQN